MSKSKTRRTSRDLARGRLSPERDARNGEPLPQPTLIRALLSPHDLDRVEAALLYACQASAEAPISTEAIMRNVDQLREANRIMATLRGTPDFSGPTRPESLGEGTPLGSRRAAGSPLG